MKGNCALEQGIAALEKLNDDLWSPVMVILKLKKKDYPLHPSHSNDRQMIAKKIFDVHRGRDILYAIVQQ